MIASPTAVVDGSGIGSINSSPLAPISALRASDPENGVGVTLGVSRMRPSVSTKKRQSARKCRCGLNHDGSHSVVHSGGNIGCRDVIEVSQSEAVPRQ